MNQFCDKCGSQINQTTGTCPNCAPNYVVNNQPQVNKPENKKHTTKEVVAVVVAIALFSGLFGIIGYVFGKVQNSLPKSYNEIVERYKLVMAGEEDDEKTLSNKLIDKVNEFDNYEICYSYIDINNDKTKELIIGGHVADEDVETYDIYTMDSDKNAVQLLPVNNYDEDTEIEIYKEVIKVSEEKEETSHFEYLKLPENQWEVEKDEEYLYEDEKYFEVIEEEKNEISEETFKEADTKYEGEELDLEWVKVVLEEDKKEKDTNTTTLTDAQIASFEDMLNNTSYCSFEPLGENKVDGIVYTFIFLDSYSSPAGGLYDYYFNQDYDRKDTKSGNTVKVTYTYNADKVLFILNDVFGLNVDKSYTLNEGNDKLYFKGDKFYAETIEVFGGDIAPQFKVASYESVSDAYFKIETKAYIDGTELTGVNGRYYIAKPAKHSLYGDYWKIREYGKGDEVYWSNSDNNDTKPTETTTTEQTVTKANNYGIYNDLLEMYYTSISCGWSNLDGEIEGICDPDSANYMFYHSTNNKSLNDIGYTLIDIDNNGQDELIVSPIDKSGTSTIYDMYTVIDGEIIRVIYSVERDTYVLAVDNTIINYGSGSAMTSSRTNCYLEGSTGKLRVKKAVVYDGYADPNNPWFYADTEYYDSETYEKIPGALKPISEAKAKNIENNFPAKKAMQLTPFSLYKVQ